MTDLGSATGKHVRACVGFQDADAEDAYEQLEDWLRDGEDIGMIR